MSTQLKLADFLSPDADAARARLTTVGAAHIPALDLTREVPGVGTISRHFGVVTPALRAPRAMAELIRGFVSHAENKRFAADLRSKKAPHIPMNKRLVERLVPSLHEHGVHLPWTFSPLGALLRRRCEQVARNGDLSFVVFYGHLTEFSGPDVTLGRVFSNPLQLGGPSHTWMQPIYDEMLDDEVALLVESDALVSAG